MVSVDLVDSEDPSKLKEKYTSELNSNVDNIKTDIILTLYIIKNSDLFQFSEKVLFYFLNKENFLVIRNNLFLYCFSYQ